MRAFLFDTKVANEVGVEAAVVLQNMDYVVNDDCFCNGGTWGSYENLSNLFPFFTKRKLKKLLEILVNEGYIEQKEASIYPREDTEEIMDVYRITDKGYLIMGDEKHEN